MARSLSFFSFALIVLTVIVIGTIVPGEASAHVSVHEPLEILQGMDAEEPEPHCHGEIECVVTLYPASAEGLAPMPIPALDHIASHVIEPVGAGLRHDPPIPIFT